MKQITPWHDRTEVRLIPNGKDWNDSHQAIVDKAKADEIAELRVALDTAQTVPEMISKHSAEDNYQHFLAYSQLPHSDILRFAYYHGADADCDKPQVQEPSAYEVSGPYERQVFKDTSSAEAYRCGLNRGYGAEAYLTRPLYAALTAAKQTQPEPPKDHETAKLVSDIAHIARELHDSQSLRERIAQLVRPWAKGMQPERAPTICKGPNCSAKNGVGHSEPCTAEHDAASLDTAGNRHPEFRYAGYKGQPLKAGASQDQSDAYAEGVRAAAPQPKDMK